MTIRNPFTRRGAAVDLSARSPFSRSVMPGVPNAPTRIKDVTFRNGRPEIAGTPLPTLEPLRAPFQSDDIPPPQSQYNPGLYADAATIPITAGAAGEIMVLARPSKTRISLLIQNQTVAGGITYCFDRAAGATDVIILAGGNRLFDFSVPQGDLHIFFTGAGVVTIEYMNRDITKENYR